MSHYNATEGENWLSPMLAHYSRCGPNCPQEGAIRNYFSWYLLLSINKISEKKKLNFFALIVFFAYQQDASRKKVCTCFSISIVLVDWFR